MARVCIISEDSATISRVINNANTRKISIIKGQCHEINFIIGLAVDSEGKSTWVVLISLNRLKLSTSTIKMKENQKSKT